MELQRVLKAIDRNRPPIKPLEGYFRFRQEMMASLDQKDRTCENIIRLWNKLTEEQKAIREQQQKLQLHQYLRLLKQWEDNSKLSQVKQQTIVQGKGLTLGVNQECLFGYELSSQVEQEKVSICKLQKKKSIRKECNFKSQIQNKHNKIKRNS